MDFDYPVASNDDLETIDLEAFKKIEERCRDHHLRPANGKTYKVTRAWRTLENVYNDLFGLAFETHRTSKGKRPMRNYSIKKELLKVWRAACLQRASSTNKPQPLLNQLLNI